MGGNELPTGGRPLTPLLNLKLGGKSETSGGRGVGPLFVMVTFSLEVVDLLTDLGLAGQEENRCIQLSFLLGPNLYLY